MRLYTLLVLLLLPLLLLRLLARGVREPGYLLDLRGRFGRVAGGAPSDVLWCHAVSAGEVIAATPLLRRLHDDAPGVPILVTVTTATGRARARALLGDIAHVAWLPFDVPVCLDRFISRIRPRLLLIMETELWPNLVTCTTRRGIPVALVNARLSEASARGYAHIAGLTRSMLSRVDALLCQDEAGARRFAGLGADPDRIHVTGSLKFEPLVPDDMDARVGVLRRRLRGDAAFVVVAGSTHAGEEDRLLDALAPLLRAHADWRLVVAPRHPQRVASVIARCRTAGLSACASSELGERPVDPGARVLVLDEMGVLFAAYGIADLAFVGGTLVPVGGHNTIEPAWHGVPVFVGPHDEDFRAVNDGLEAVGALERVQDASDLSAVVEALAADAGERGRRGRAGARAVSEASGALEQVHALLRPLLEDGPDQLPVLDED